MHKHEDQEDISKIHNSFPVFHPQPRNHIQRQPHKKPNSTKNHENRYQHRIRKREVSRLIILLQQQYPEEDPNNKRNAE